MAKDMLVRAKTLKIKGIDVQPINPCSFSPRIIYIYIIIYIKLINYFLLCPVVDRETKFAFTTKGLVILSVLMIFIWQTMVK